MRRIIVILACLMLNSGLAAMEDPTKPMTFTPSQAGKSCDQILVVTAIVSSKKNKWVLVNNEYYKAGDVVDGYTVKKINPYSVEFSGKTNNVIRPIFAENACINEVKDKNEKTNIKDDKKSNEEKSIKNG